MGETPELRNLCVCAGFNSVGIASAGGAGKCLVEWLIEGRPTIDLWSVDIRRFGPLLNNVTFLRERVAEILGLHYQAAWPNREFETARNPRKSSIHERLAERGARFGVKNGWERPNWFARYGMQPVTEYSFGRQNWFNCHAIERRADREAVALFDQTDFSKFQLKGRDACAVLQGLCGNKIDVPPGRAVYTGLFDVRGKFESDLTVIRLAVNEFYIVTGSGQTARDHNWITRNITPAEQAELTDLSSSCAVLGAALTMAYVSDPGGVNADFIMSGRYEIQINGRRYSATPHLRAPYPPRGGNA